VIKRASNAPNEDGTRPVVGEVGAVGVVVTGAEVVVLLENVFDEPEHAPSTAAITTPVSATRSRSPTPTVWPEPRQRGRTFFGCSARLARRLPELLSERFSAARQ